VFFSQAATKKTKTKKHPPQNHSQSTRSLEISDNEHPFREDLGADFTNPLLY
jgi:hypothetical protein